MSHQPPRFFVLGLLLISVSALSAAPAEAHERAAKAWKSPPGGVQLGVSGWQSPVWIDFESALKATIRQARAPASVAQEAWPLEITRAVGQQLEPDPAYMPVSDSFKRRMGY